MKYTLIRYMNTQRGIIKEYYTKDRKWAIATNNAMTFSSVKSASTTYNKPEFNQAICTHTYIEGPKGGVYSAYTGRYLRD